MNYRAFVYVVCMLISVVLGVLSTRELSTPVVHAQSSTWEVIAQPEAVANVSLSIVRHVVTKDCLVIVQSGSGVAVVQGYGASGFCDTPEEYEQRKRSWEDVATSGWTLEGTPYLRMAPDNVTSQPSAGQTSKQPGVPR